MKYKRWMQHEKVSVSGEAGGLLRFSARPRGGWFVWGFWSQRKEILSKLQEI